MRVHIICLLILGKKVQKQQNFEKKIHEELWKNQGRHSLVSTVKRLPHSQEQNLQ